MVQALVVIACLGWAEVPPVLLVLSYSIPCLQDLVCHGLSWGWY